MEKVWIDLGEASYNIHIGRQLLSGILEHLKGSDKFIVITDKNVDALYGMALGEALAGSTYCKYVMEPGEENKNMSIAMQILSFMAECHLTRQSWVVAFGGGVVGDVAGFCASIYMRGVPFVQVPTTLLAQVDSSVGGKTGINLPAAKNIIGTFYQPKAVIIDTEVLHTLGEREVLSGIGEIIKYGIIQDYRFFCYVKERIAAIRNLEDTVLKQVIRRCCEIKAKIVAMDEKESGLRKILNYGHTIGHALEGITGYQKYTHGEAVLIGMYHEAGIAKRMGLIEEAYFHEITDFILHLGVPVDISMYDLQKLLDVMASDKKNSNEKLSFILPVGKGKVKEFLFERNKIGIVG